MITKWLTESSSLKRVFDQRVRRSQKTSYSRRNALKTPSLHQRLLTVTNKYTYKSETYIKNPGLEVSQTKRGLMRLISATPIFLIACANIVPPCPGKTTPPYSELVGTQWELNRWNMPPNSMGEVRLRSMPSDGGPKISLQFSQGRMSGYSGCNRFTAQIIEDPRGFQIEQIATTRMACASNREDIERDFLYLLRDYRSIARDGNYLLIIGPNREVLGFNLIQRTNP